MKKCTDIIVLIFILSIGQLVAMDTPDGIAYDNAAGMYVDCGWSFKNVEQVSKAQSALNKLESILKPIGAWYDPVPKDTPLDKDRVMNNFWQRMEDKSQEEKDEAFIKYAVSGYDDYTRHIQWLQIVAGVHAGANPNKCPKYETSALNRAVDNDYYALVKFLLDHNADPNIISSFDERTPLFDAENAAMAQLLVSKGALIQNQDYIGSNLLHNVICHHYQPALIKYYHSQGVRYDAQNKYGNTSLELLTIHNNFYGISFKDYAKAFLESGVTQEEVLAAFEKARAQKQDDMNLEKNYRRFIEIVVEKAIGPSPEIDADFCYAEQREKAFYAMSK